MDQTKYYVFYDGDCAFCNYSVQWILKRDYNDKFLFSSLQSDFGKKFINERGLEKYGNETLFLWKPGSYYVMKSQAIFEIASLLGGKYKVASWAKLLPSAITDWGYMYIAKRRKNIKTTSCWVPTEKDKKKIVV